MLPLNNTEYYVRFSKQGWPSIVLVFSPHISKDYFHLHEYIVCDIVELTEGEG